MEKLTCYRKKDLEGDIWCEQAFLFENSSDVEKFFTKEKIAELYFDGKIDEVKSIIFHRVRPENETPYYVEINGGGWGGIEIVEMYGGYFINAL
jgi:hypothetical protein